MSAYTTLQTHLVSARHLHQALKDLGFNEVELHERDPQPLNGSMADGSTLRAEVIIRRRFISGGFGDIGFVRNPQGRLDVVIAEQDRRQFDVAWLLRLRQRYAYHVVQDQLTQQGFSLVNEAVDANQSIRLVLRRTV